MPITAEIEEAFEVIGGEASCGLVIVCDHATNAIPSQFGTLGLPENELGRHIAYDIGTETLTRMLAESMRAPAVLSRFSRLFIDPNRGEDDPTLIMRISDGALVPGNRDVDADERERRLARFHRPYHGAIDRVIDLCIAEGRVPAVLSIHSYTPEWKGVPRPWHAGILWDRDPRLARPLIDRLAAIPGLFVGDNEPYTGALRNDTMFRHCTARGIAHALVEVRNDLIATPGGLQEWADRIHAVLDDVLGDEALYAIEQHGSTVDRSSS